MNKSQLCSFFCPSGAGFQPGKKQHGLEEVGGGYKALARQSFYKVGSLKGQLGRPVGGFLGFMARALPKER